MTLQLKVCGMRDRENILQVAALQPDYMGFIFYPLSPRYLGSPADFPKTELESICTVGVFVDEKEVDILRKVKEFGLKAVQLHGHESPEFCARIKSYGLKVLKAVPVADKADLHPIKAYEASVDLMVLDTKTSGYGGSGNKFNWNVLDFYTFDIPFLLSGGIQPGDAGEIHRLNHPKLAGVDINSRFEISKGLKDLTKIKQFKADLHA